MPPRAYTVRPSLSTALIGLLVFVAFVYGVVKLTAFAFEYIWIVGPALLLLAYLVDRRTVQGYFRWLGATVRENPLTGLFYGVLSALTLPLVAGWLLVKGLAKRFVRGKLEDMQERMREQAGPFATGGFGAPGAGALGDDPDGYREVRREDGLVIRIPREDEPA